MTVPGVPEVPESGPDASFVFSLLRDSQIIFRYLGWRGDDYELIFSAAPEKRPEIAELAARLDLPLWRIGRTSEGTSRVKLLDEEGQCVPLAYKGFDHFGHGNQ